MKTSLRIAALATVFAGLVACGGSSTPEQHVATARNFIAESDYQSAVIELKNALQQDGKFGEARLMLGIVYLETGDPVSAEKELRRARKLGISDAEISPSLARALFQQQQFENLDEVQSEGLAPSDEATVLSLKARAAMALGENQKAKRYLAEALSRDESSADALLARAELALSQGELEETRATLDLLLAEHGKHPHALAMRGDTLLAQQDIQGAMNAYKEALAANADMHAHRVKLALLALQSDDLEQARAQARELRQRAPKSPAADYIQGLLHFQAGEYAESIARLSAVEPAYEQFPLTLYFLGSAHLQEGNIDQAGILAGRFYDLAPGNINGRKLLAATQLQRREFDKVETLLQPVIDAYPEDVDAMNLMANAAIGKGDIDTGLKLLQQAAELQPDSASAQIKLGAGLLMSGKNEEATSQLQTALELNPELQQADILLVLNHMRNGKHEEAMAAAESFRRRQPNDTAPLNLLGRIHLELDNQEQAREAFNNALDIDAGDPAANQSLAQLALAKGDLDTARGYYNSILEKHPDDLRTTILLALLEAREKDGEAFVARLESANTAHPNAVEPRLLLGQFYMQQGRPEKVAPLFDTLEEAQRESVPALNLTASAQLAQGQYADTIHTLQKLMARAPETAAMHYYMAMAQAGTQENEAAEQSLETALALDADYLPARIALTRIHLVRKETEQFTANLDILAKQAPDNADILSLQASGAFIDGDLESANRFAAKAFEVNPNSQTVVALAEYSSAAGDAAGAKELLANWLEENPDDQHVRLMAANTLLIGGQDVEAITHFESLLKANPDNVIALNNLAWLIRESEPQRALTYVSRARDLAPNSADVLDTLAVVQYINKEYASAASNIREALLRNPDNPTLHYHEAMIAAAMGRNDTAAGILEKLLSGTVEFPERAKAQALLDKLK